RPANAGLSRCSAPDGRGDVVDEVRGDVFRPDDTLRESQVLLHQTMHVRTRRRAHLRLLLLVGKTLSSLLSSSSCTVSKLRVESITGYPREAAILRYSSFSSLRTSDAYLMWFPLPRMISIDLVTGTSRTKARFGLGSM